MYRYPVGGWAEVGARKESTVKRRLNYRVQMRATIFPQVDERMNKIQFLAEDLPSRRVVLRRICIRITRPCIPPTCVIL